MNQRNGYRYEGIIGTTLFPLLFFKLDVHIHLNVYLMLPAFYYRYFCSFSSSQYGIGIYDNSGSKYITRCTHECYTTIYSYLLFNSLVYSSLHNGLFYLFKPYGSSLLC